MTIVIQLITLLTTIVLLLVTLLTTIVILLIATHEPPSTGCPEPEPSRSTDMGTAKEERVRVAGGHKHAIREQCLPHAARLNLQHSLDWALEYHTLILFS